MGKNKGIKWIAALAVIVLAGIGITYAVGRSGDDEGSLRYEAMESCHGWVKDKLSSPGTANFSGENTTGSNGDYSIVGAVDSQNGFGAVVRSTWLCTVRLDGDTWRGSATVG